MDRYIIGPKPRTVLSYFLPDSGLQTSINESEVVALPRVEPERSLISIFCDGACINNGRRGARASYGVVAYRGGGGIGVELYTAAQVLSSAEPQTNQRAELRGLAAALAYAETAAHAGATTIHIYTDSEYALNCLTKWITGWQRNGWRRSDGSPVLHRDIIEPFYDTWNALRGIVFAHHVTAHTGRDDAISRGNERADMLARNALSNSISSYF